MIVAGGTDPDLVRDPVAGLLGLGASAHWGRRTHWRNVDEVLRAAVPFWYRSGC